MATDNLEKLKKDFSNWSGFDLIETDPEAIIKEIEERKYQLECEISDYARGLEARVKNIFPNHDFY